MNTQRTSGHSRDDLWFHTQGEEDQTLTNCSGIFGRDAKPTVSLFTHIRGGNKTTTLSIVHVFGSHTIEYMEIRSAYSPKFQPIPIPQLLSHYPNAVTREVFSTFGKQKWESHFCHLSLSRSTWDFLVGSSIHHPPWSPQVIMGCVFFAKNWGAKQEISIWAAKGAIAMASFPTSILGPGTSGRVTLTARYKKKQAKPGASFTLTTSENQEFLISLERKILDQVACLEEQWMEMKHFHFHLNNWSMFFLAHC